jgi:hypothetical protein
MSGPLRPEIGAPSCRNSAREASAFWCDPYGFAMGPIASFLVIT